MRHAPPPGAYAVLTGNILPNRWRKYQCYSQGNWPIRSVRDTPWQKSGL